MHKRLIQQNYPQKNTDEIGRYKINLNIDLNTQTK